MNTGLTLIYTTFLYYLCMVLIGKYILMYVPKKGSLILSFLIFFPFSWVILTQNAAVYVPCYIGVLVLQFLLIKRSFIGARTRSLVFSYLILLCANAILAAPVSTLIPGKYIYVDVLVASIIGATVILICTTRIRLLIRQMLEWTPKRILAISAILLVITACMSVLISGFQYAMFPHMWDKWTQVFSLALLLAICAIIPVVLMISVSNTQLKTLTADYEQQIRAQAEHYKNLANASRDMQQFRHDYKNMHIAVERLLEQGDQAGALALLRQGSESLEHPGGYRAAFQTGNGIADALLTDKQKRASACNTKICFEGMIPQELLSPTELCVLLGNSIDNALDACEKLSPEEEKRICVTCRCANGFLFFTVTNPVGEKVQIRDNHIATTKENKTLHGFGLYSLHAIVKKHDGQLQLSSTENSFTVSIDLCVPT